ncbi:MAG TPA: heat-inducible transcriptional repressor HrcA [Chromatiaceae bacterium]|nr:heat-inducible transcriptional repressor HrcA [Chromatiaceae bacterium]
MSPASSQDLNERARHFLKVLVERYIADGQPVGSRTLARDAGTNLSPATIRNVMADLEDMGLIVSPHTSAGRVPTSDGYRVFVDSLVTLQPLDQQAVSHLHGELRAEADPNALIQSASQLLSGLTRMAGVVMIPRRNRILLRQIEFLPMSEQRVLAILVTEEGGVHNRLLHTRKTYSPAELERAGNFLTSTFGGKDLAEIRRDLVAQLHDERSQMDQAMSDALAMAEDAVVAADEGDDYIISGQTNLMNFNELADLDRLKQLFETFSHKQEMLHLLDQCMKADGLQIFIGEESGYKTFGDCSLISASYGDEGSAAGVLAVIGPTRMAYEKVIPIVDITAKLLGAALKK